MAERALIGIQNVVDGKDSSVTYVYLHKDGEPSRMLPLLRKHYSSESKLRVLLRGGDMSTLGTTVKSTSYYGRDHGEKGPDIKPKKRRFMPDDAEALEYQYLFDARAGGWWWREDGGSSWHPPDEDGETAPTCHHCKEPIEGAPVTVNTKPPRHYHLHHVKHRGAVAKRVAAKRKKTTKKAEKKGFLDWLFGGI